MDADRYGRLYVVATPIGNMEDITFRAIRILKEVDLIAAEDTRSTARLLHHYHISVPLISCHEHNEDQRVYLLIEKLQSGQTIALVSDAGTPLISDPGYRLISQAIAHEIPVIPIPGPSAAISALSVSGLPTDAFHFIGFLPKKATKRCQLLGQLAKESGTLIFYESPKRLLRTLDEIHQNMGNRQVVVAREMTKSYEEFIRGTVSQVRDQLSTRDVIKGECTLLVSGKTDDLEGSMDAILAELKAALARPDAKVSAISKALAKKYSISKKELYTLALRVKASSDELGRF